MSLWSSCGKSLWSCACSNWISQSSPKPSASQMNVQSSPYGTYWSKHEIDRHDMRSAFCYVLLGASQLGHSLSICVARICCAFTFFLLMCHLLRVLLLFHLFFTSSPPIATTLYLYLSQDRRFDETGRSFFDNHHAHSWLHSWLSLSIFRSFYSSISSLTMFLKLIKALKPNGRLVKS